jgi:hypothetical protein
MGKEANFEDVVRLMSRLKAQASESIAKSKKLISLASERLEKSRRQPAEPRRP